MWRIEPHLTCPSLLRKVRNCMLMWKKNILRESFQSHASPVSILSIKTLRDVDLTAAWKYFVFQYVFFLPYTVHNTLIHSIVNFSNSILDTCQSNKSRHLTYKWYSIISWCDWRTDWRVKDLNLQLPLLEAQVIAVVG